MIAETEDSVFDSSSSAMLVRTSIADAVGAELLDSLNRNVRTECGFATLHSVTDRSLEDRMESFFLYVSAILRIFKRRLSEKITVK